MEKLTLRPNKMDKPHALPYFAPYIVPCMTILSQHSSKPWHALFPSIFIWIMVPCLDWIIPSLPASVRPLSRSGRAHLESQLSFRLAVYLWPLTQFSMLLWSAHRISSVSLDALRVVGLLSALILIGAGGINCSHELLHRRSIPERFLGDLLLCSVCYGHFAIEHARGHHFRVATPEDPATLRFGESFYAFLPRAVFGGYLSACKLEHARLVASGLPWFCLQNQMLWYAFMQLCFPFVFWYLFGWVGVAVFLFQAFWAVVLLEQINAIEHYGLLRKRREDGSYERVGPRHSWDASQSISSYFMFKLQLHADHHLRTSLVKFAFLP